MEKCLVIVGRSKSAKKFTQEIAEPLVEQLKEEEFLIEAVDSLGDFSDLDESSRFIAFVLVDDNSKKEMKIQQLFSSLMKLQMGVRLFENIEDARTYAEEHYLYNLEVEEEENEENEDENDDFPQFTAEEIEDFYMFESLFRTGKLTTLKGRVFGDSATVMAHVVQGPGQIRVTPYALMVNSTLLENLELPEINERD